MSYNEKLPPIDEVLNSVGKVRIIRILAVKDELNITAISTMSGLNHSRVKDHLKELLGMDIVNIKRFGRIQIYSINESSNAGKRLYQFFGTWYDNSKEDI